MRPLPALSISLALALSVPAFAQEKAKDEKPTIPDSGLVAISGVSSAYMFESHRKIGYAVDAYAAKSIDIGTAAKDLGATPGGLLLMVEKQLADMAGAVALSENDAKIFADIRSVLKTEANSIDSILAYMRDKNEDDSKAYATYRTAAWKGLATLMNLGVADKKAMQGTWIVTKAGSDGEEAPDEALKTLRFVIKDDVIAFSQGKESSSVRIVFNPIGNPPQLDAEVLDGAMKGKTRFAIFEIQGDTMKLCWTRGDKRPTKFSNDQGPEVVNFELKRVKE